MRVIERKTGLVVLLLSFACLSATPVLADKSRNYYQREKSCAEKIMRVATPIEIPVPALSLDRASLEPHERDLKRVGSYFYYVEVPLKTSSSKVGAVWFYAELDEAITVLRLIREGKVKALVISPTNFYVHDILAEMFPAAPETEESMNGLEACSEELILKKMQFCAKCRLKTYQGVMP